jgi:GH25 family lysozyme M1 (1,4-beta-N-acetylmuramidase)
LLQQIQPIILKEIHIHLIILSSHSNFNMKYSTALIAAAFGLVSAKPSRLDARTNPQGFDVSSYQGNVDWAKAKSDGASFAIIKVPASSLSMFCH